MGKNNYLQLFLVITLAFGIGLVIGHSGLSQKLSQLIRGGNAEKAPVPLLSLITNEGMRQKIRINTEQDIVKWRNMLNHIIWNGKELPRNIYPEKIDTSITDTLFQSLENLKSVDCLTDSMAYGFVSIMYHLKPQKGDNGRVMIFHHGHEGNDYSMGMESYQMLLSAGYHVISIHMPLNGRNNVPDLNTPTTGKVMPINHDMLMFLPDGYNLFFEPVCSAINHLRRQGFEEINMMGLSGGAWTTTLYAAMDTSVRNSYPVAGSSPIAVRIFHPQDLGDLEQYNPMIFSKITYSEIYVLASSGKGRKQIQILNTYDPCCFEYDVSEYYRDAVSNTVKEVSPGYFEVWADSTHREHKISTNALERILRDLNS